MPSVASTSKHSASVMPASSFRLNAKLAILHAGRVEEASQRQPRTRMPFGKLGRRGVFGRDVAIDVFHAMIVKPLLGLFAGGTFRIFQKQHAHEQPFLELEQVRHSLCVLDANRRTTHATQACAQQNHQPTPNGGPAYGKHAASRWSAESARQSPNRPRKHANRTPHLSHLTCAVRAAPWVT